MSRDVHHRRRRVELHVQQRLREHYGVDVPDAFGQLNVRAAVAPLFVEPGENQGARQIRAVDLSGTTVRVVYDPAEGCVVTVLPIGTYEKLLLGVAP